MSEEDEKKDESGGSDWGGPRHEGIGLKLFKSLFENAPKIIAEAAKSRLGIVALVILVLFVLAGIFFWTAPIEYRAGAFIALFVGFGLFVRAVFRMDGRITPENGPQIPATEAQESPLHEKARATLDRGRKFYFAGRQDDAVSAYEQAHALFKQADDRLGEANALFSLGESRRLLGRHDAARDATRLRNVLPARQRED